MYRWHQFLAAPVRFVFSSHTCCIQCGTSRVHRIARRDPIDAMSWSPFSLAFRLLGAPLVKCEGCRLQWADWRPVPPQLRRSGAAQDAGADAPQSGAAL